MSADPQQQDFDPSTISASATKAFVMWALIVCFSITMGFAVVLLHRERRRQLAYWEERLTRVADLNQRLLENWILERQTDVLVASSVPSAIEVLSGRVGSKQHLQTEIDSLARAFDYAGVYVLDSRGVVRAASTAAPEIPPTVQQAAKAPGQRSITTIVGTPNTYPSIAFLLPIPQKSRAAKASQDRCLGSFAAVTKSEVLPSLLLHDTGATRTGETVFVGLHRGRPTFISPLRDRYAGGPTADPPSPGTSGRIALLERRQVFGGYEDYRGVKVLAVTRFLPITGWGMVTKVDRSEALASFRETHWRILVVSLAALCGLSGIALALRQTQQVLGLSAEIARRKRIEEELQKSESKFRAVVESSHEGFLFMDAAGAIRYRSPGYRAISGFEDEERIGHCGFENVHPDDLVATREAWARLLVPANSIEHGKYRIRHKDGGWRWVETSAQNLLDNPNVRAVVLSSRDVTSQVQAELALQESEARYRLLFERNIAGMCRVTADGRFLDCNESFAHILGYSRAELLEVPATALYEQPVDRGPSVAKLRTGHSLRDHELRLKHKDGHRIWALSNAAFVPGPAGESDVIEATLVDITERKRAEDEIRARNEALRISEREYRTLFDSANDAILVFEPKNEVILDANAAARAIYGFTRDELLRMSLRELTKNQSAGKAQIRELLATGTYRGYESVHFNRKGEELHFLINSSVIEYRGITAILSVNRDITDRKRAEDALRSAAERQALMIEAANLGTWEWDVASGALIWSDRTYEFFGLVPGAKIDYGRFLEWLHPEDRKRIDEAARTAVEQGTMFDVEERSVWPDGSVHWITMVGRACYDVSGRPIRMTGVAMDITDRRDLEEQLRQSQKMESLGRLAGGIAHDFNNLLTIININAALMLQSSACERAVRDKVTQIIDVTERGSALTRQLLAFSRKQVLEPTTIDLNLLTQGMVRLFRRTLREDVRVTVSACDGACTVNADALGIEQVILNLAANAQDAMPNGGQLIIETAIVEMGKVVVPKLLPPGKYVMLAITDTGIGMDPVTQARAFDPFFTTKPPGKGTGLGLSTSYGIIRQSGGYLLLYSERGKGTTAKIYLPHVQGQHTARISWDTNSVSNRHGETVLLVEDETDVRVAVAEFLRSQGYKVIEAADGSAAIKTATSRSEAIHALITDIVMPGLSGRELADILSQLRPEMKVLYLSGYADKAACELGLQAGREFLQKPFAVEQLAAKLQRLIC